MRIERGMHGSWKVFAEKDGKEEMIGWAIRVSNHGEPSKWRGYGNGWDASKTHFDTKEKAGEQLENDWKERTL